MIYDCMPFWKDLDILELRLREFAGVVDRFVLVESETTHAGNPTPAYLRDNMGRYSDFASQIIYVPLELNRASPVQERERAQRDAILLGLDGAHPDDTVILSDVDEFPPVEEIVQYLDFPGLVCFRPCWHMYYLNGHVGFHGGGPSMCRRRVLDRYLPSVVRAAEALPDMPTITRDSGVHFSWTGGPEWAIEKLYNHAHRDLYDKFPYNEPGYMAWAIRAGRAFIDGAVVTYQTLLDEHYPRVLREDPGPWAHLLHGFGSEGTAR
jgi:beta-1,4-mannosyl-glycoprotein beta-1,4-N-acetylglucosaminyltransferase